MKATTTQSPTDSTSTSNTMSIPSNIDDGSSNFNWNGLPDELKLMILDHAFTYDKPVTFRQIMQQKVRGMLNLNSMFRKQGLAQLFRDNTFELHVYIDGPRRGFLVDERELNFLLWYQVVDLSTEGFPYINLCHEVQHISLVPDFVNTPDGLRRHGIAMSAYPFSVRYHGLGLADLPLPQLKTVVLDLEKAATVNADALQAKYPDRLDIRDYLKDLILFHLWHTDPPDVEASYFTSTPIAQLMYDDYSTEWYEPFRRHAEKRIQEADDMLKRLMDTGK